MEERLTGEGFEFKVDREFQLILFIEALTITAWVIAPEIVLLNYIVNVLKLTLFEAMIVEASMSLSAVLATYLTDRINPKHRYKVIASNYLMNSIWAAIMYLTPPFTLVVTAYFISRFGDTLAFPFYRTWIYSKIPKEKASSLLSTLSSYRKTITLISPAIAGTLATITPTLPYLISLTLFLISASTLLIYSKKLESKEPG